MPRRRARSTWGSNEDAGNGRRRLRYWADLHDGRGYTRHSMTIVGTRRDGDETLARLRVEHSADRPTPTLRQAYEAWWLPEATARLDAGELSRSTYVNYASRWRAHVAPAFGQVPVTDIRPAMVQEWLSGLTRTMGAASLRVLRQVLDECVMREVVPVNVADGRYRLSRRTERDRPKDVYALAEMTAALDAVRGTVAYVPAVLCGLASCRVGESLGIMRSEVRRAEAAGMTLAVADVRRQVDRYGRVSERMKTPQSARPVVVPEPWSLELLGVSDTWLVDNGLGEPLSQEVVGRAWRDALAAAGIDPIPFQNLRNSWRTIMRWELAVDEDKVERMMGHAGRGVGEIHYDRPQWEVFASTVAEAWVRHRARG